VPTPRPAALAGLRGDLVVHETAEACARALASDLSVHLRDRLECQAHVHLALSGGSSGQLLCQELAIPEIARVLAWPRVHLWMVDERCVPDDDPRLNFALFRDQLAPRIPIPRDNLHPMPVLAADGAQRYEQDLRAALAEDRGGPGSLDAVVLGMGGDGHTASLFPGSPAVREHERWVVLNDGDRVTLPRPRMTLTYPALNRAKRIAILVTGAAKAQTLREVASRPEAHEDLPVTGLVPAPGTRLAWYLDRAALPR
jgi:6-phosphogluconolactonase